VRGNGVLLVENELDSLNTFIDEILALNVGNALLSESFNGNDSASVCETSRNCGVPSGFLCRSYMYTLSIDTFECFAQSEYFCVMIQKMSATHIRRDFRSVFPS